MAVTLTSIGRGVPRDDAHVYLPSPEDLESIKNSTFDLKEHPVEVGKEAVKNQLFNFEHCLQLIQLRHSASPFKSEQEFDDNCIKVLAEFRVKKTLGKLVKEVVFEKSLAYQFRIIAEPNTKLQKIIISDPKRLNIGQVTRGAFSQITGMGTAFAMIQQPQGLDFDVFQVLKQQRQTTKSPIYVLYRNINDTVYKVAKVGK